MEMTEYRMPDMDSTQKDQKIAQLEAENARLERLVKIYADSIGMATDFLTGWHLRLLSLVVRK